MASKYISKFSGEEIDKGVQIALDLEKVIDHIKLESSVDKKYDMNKLLKPGVYDIDYYTNSYNDLSTQRPITVSVTRLSNSWMEQAYRAGSEKVHRYYSILNKEFTPWKVISDIISVDHTETVEVSKTTVVLRHGGDTVLTSPDPTTL